MKLPDICLHTLTTENKCYMLSSNIQADLTRLDSHFMCAH